VSEETQKEPTISGEQQADLLQLQRLAAEGEAAANAPVAGQAEPVREGPTLEQEIAAMLTMVAGMVKPALPSVAALYPPQVCETIGTTLGAVCNKHGWLQSGIGGKYGEEIMCLVILGPLAWATVEAAKGDIAARKPKKPEEQIVVPSTPTGETFEIRLQPDAGKTVRFG
jgi:hypothetical protein